MQYMNREFWIRILKLLSISLVIDTILVLYQFIVITQNPDYLNGIFGHTTLNNAASGTFCLIMAMIGIVSYIKKLYNKSVSIALILMSSAICALSEIKAFFILLAVGVVIALLVGATNKKELFRRIRLILIVITIGAMAIYILYQIMPQNLVAFTSLTNWIKYEEYSTYYIGRGIGRTNQLTYVFENEFKYSFLSSFFGKGLGYDSLYIPYELGRFYANFGILGLMLLLIFLLSLVIRSYGLRKQNPETMICLLIAVLFALDMIVWNATFNRMAILWFTLFGLVSNKMRKGFEKKELLLGEE